MQANNRRRLSRYRRTKSSDRAPFLLTAAGQDQLKSNLDRTKPHSEMVWPKAVNTNVQLPPGRPLNNSCWESVQTLPLAE